MLILVDAGQAIAANLVDVHSIHGGLGMGEGSARIPQLERFIKAARELGCNESEANFDASLKKVARHKPIETPPPAKPERKKP